MSNDFESKDTGQCPKCGVFLTGEESFCMTCGYDLNQPEETGDLGLWESPKPASEPDEEPAQIEEKPRTKWVAEVWIDPEWYRTQSSPDQLPSPGQPEIIGLHEDVIAIGRPTAEQPSPQINCATDSGVSRQHARLISDGKRWWVEDAGSSNGTFVGVIDQTLPAESITGRVEIGPHHRVYVGSWTRIVVRAALVQESDL